MKVSLASLLQVVLLDRLEGEIRISPEGKICVLGGHVVGCEIGYLRREEALLECVFRGGESFVFVDADVAGDPLEGINHILFEAYRLKDEWSQIRRKIFALSSRVRVPPEMHRLLSKLDGKKSLSEVVVESRIPATRVLDDFLALRGKGIVTSRGEAPEEPEKSFYEWVDVARARWKKKDLRGAERAFVKALSIRPTDKTTQHNLARVRELCHGDTKQSGTNE